MSYYNDLDKHMKNNFDNFEDIKELKVLPTKSELNDKITTNSLYKVVFAAISVDVVDFKAMSENTDDAIFNIIMNEFIFGVTKIMKEFKVPSRIDIQGDAVHAIYRVENLGDVDMIFDITCALNTFQSHLKKNIETKFPQKLKKQPYNYYQTAEFSFGIGASLSFDNYISKVGSGNDTDLIFMGHALNCASSLAGSAARSGRENIIIDDLMYENFTEKHKKHVKESGGVTKVFSMKHPYDENVYQCNWVLTNYNNFINNSV